MNSITLTYTPEDEWHGELAAKLRWGEFSGHGSAWFNVAEVRAFARSIGTYPIEASSALLIQGGSWNDDHTLDQVHFEFKIKPHGRTGALSARVHLLATDIYTSFASEVRVELPITYGDLANFQSSLFAHLNRQTAQATLKLSPT